MKYIVMTAFAILATIVTFGGMIGIVKLWSALEQPFGLIGFIVTILAGTIWFLGTSYTTIDWVLPKLRRRFQ